jgi:hypothetical protein
MRSQGLLVRAVRCGSASALVGDSWATGGTLAAVRWPPHWERNGELSLADR